MYNGAVGSTAVRISTNNAVIAASYGNTDIPGV